MVFEQEDILARRKAFDNWAYKKDALRVVRGFLAAFVDKDSSRLGLQLDTVNYQPRTDGKTIWTSVMDFELAFPEENWLTFLVGNTVHECGHINCSNFSDMEEVGKWYGKYMQGLWKAAGHDGSVAAAAQEIGHSILNAVEDGRIEAIQVRNHPGVYKALHFSNMVMRDMAVIEKVAENQKGEYAHFFNCLLTYAKTGMYPEGAELYAGTPLEDTILQLSPLIDAGVKAISSEDCRKVVEEMLEKAAPYLIRLLESEDLQQEQKQNGAKPREYTGNGEREYNLPSANNPLRVDHPEQQNQGQGNQQQQEQQRNGQGNSQGQSQGNSQGESQSNSAGGSQGQTQNSTQGSNPQQNPSNSQGKQPQKSSSNSQGEQQGSNKSQGEQGNQPQQGSDNSQSGSGGDESQNNPQNGSQQPEGNENSQAGTQKDAQQGGDEKSNGGSSSDNSQQDPKQGESGNSDKSQAEGSGEKKEGEKKDSGTDGDSQKNEGSDGKDQKDGESKDGTQANGESEENPDGKTGDQSDGKSETNGSANEKSDDKSDGKTDGKSDDGSDGNSGDKSDETSDSKGEGKESEGEGKNDSGNSQQDSKKSSGDGSQQGQDGNPEDSSSSQNGDGQDGQTNGQSSDAQSSGKSDGKNHTEGSNGPRSSGGDNQNGGFTPQVAPPKKGFQEAKQNETPLDTASMEEYGKLLSKFADGVRQVKEKEQTSQGAISQKDLNEIRSKFAGATHEVSQIPLKIRGTSPLPPVYKKQADDLRKEIKRILAEHHGDQRGLKRGSLDVKNVWKYGFNDPRLFMKKSNEELGTAAFYLLIDNSGSTMAKAYSVDGVPVRLYQAERAAAGVIEEASMGMIPCKVALFNTDGYRAEHTIIRDFKDQSRTNRSWNSVREILPDGCNTDALHIRIASLELLKRREHKKVLFILSDGQPSSFGSRNSSNIWETAQAEVHAAVQDARKKGVVVIPIMLGDEDFFEDAISDYQKMYGKNIVKCLPQQLTTKLTRLFKEIISG